jgi:hypothetical protein
MTFLYLIGGIVSLFALLCLTAVMCAPSLEDMDTERL